MLWLQDVLAFCGHALLLQIGIFMLLPCIMHHNPTEPNKRAVVAGLVQLLCTCTAATHWYLRAVHHQGWHILSWPIRRGQESCQHLHGGLSHWSGHSSHLLTGSAPPHHQHTRSLCTRN